MATVYLQPGTGTGTGTASDPYFYSQLSTAETAAGPGGTILFTDGEYSLTGTTIWDGVGTSGNDITYKSLNLQGAVIKSNTLGTLRQLDLGSDYNVSTTNLQNFKFIDIKFHFYNKGPGEISGNLITTSTAVNLPSTGFLRVKYTSTTKFLNNTVNFQYNSGNYFENGTNKLAEFSGNSIFISSLNGKTGPVYYTYSTSTDLRSCPIVKNNIFATDDTTGAVLDTQNSFSGSFNNCCFFQFDDSNNGSGGTDNVFADPQFVDQASGDLRLRPTSPCINGGVKTGIQVIQDKYPSAIWFDSAHTGTESGTVDEPYNTIGEAMTAASGGGVIAIKNGTHSVTKITLSKSLTFVGESTEAIISASGGTYGGAITARNTSHSIKLENLKVYHDSTSTTYSLIDCGNVASATVTVEGCILEMGSNTLSATNNRGWFAGPNGPTTSLTVSDSVILGGTSSSSYGVVVGGDGFQDGYNALDFQKNTIVITGGSANKFSSYSTGISQSTFKNNIFVGNGNSETLGFTPTTASHNCYHNNGINSGNAPDSAGGVFADPQFIDSTNADYRLRPTSPCIDAGTN